VRFSVKAVEEIPWRIWRGFGWQFVEFYEVFGALNYEGCRWKFVKLICGLCGFRTTREAFRAEVLNLLLLSSLE
jgi:hypothetical protein